MGYISLICDGMDQAKFAYPRSPVMMGKQFSNLSRPRAHIVGMKLHGKAVFFAVSRADCAKDANHHFEFIAAALTMIQKKFQLNLRQCHLHVQSDNCCREVKNNSVLRGLSALTSKGALKIIFFVRCSFVPYPFSGCHQVYLIVPLGVQVDVLFGKRPTVIYL